MAPALARLGRDAVARLLAREGADVSEWHPIETAPRDRPVEIYAAPFEDLRGFACVATWHPEGGWCVCEIRQATHWREVGSDDRTSPIGGPL